MQRVYDVARSLAPDAEEGLGYGMPALLLRGKPLVAVAVTSTHLGLYPFSAGAMDTVRERLVGFSTAKGTVRFSAAQPVPEDVLRDLLAARVTEIEGAGPARLR